jgi:hypothetical protein
MWRWECAGFGAGWEEATRVDEEKKMARKFSNFFGRPQTLGKVQKLERPSANLLERKIFWTSTVWLPGAAGSTPWRAMAFSD